MTLLQWISFPNYISPPLSLFQFYDPVTFWGMERLMVLFIQCEIQWMDTVWLFNTAACLFFIAWIGHCCKYIILITMLRLVICWYVSFLKKCQNRYSKANNEATKIIHILVLTVFYWDSESELLLCTIKDRNKTSHYFINTSDVFDKLDINFPHLPSKMYSTPYPLL